MKSILLFVLAFSAIAVQMREPDRSSTNFETWCIGRYLIDLPKGTKVETKYITKGSAVRTLTGISMTQFLDTVAARRQSLMDTPHHSGGGMLVGTDTIMHDCITLISWGSTASKRLYDYETFQYLEKHQALYIFTGRGTANEEQRTNAASTQRTSYDELRYRAPMKIPHEAGFCIHEGIIMTDRPNQEEYTAVIRMPDYPGVVVTLESFVTNNPGDFSNRETIPFRLSLAYYIRTKTLRNRSRSIGEAHGREYLIRSRSKENGHNIYQFEWKTGGIKGSIYYPDMRLTLRTENELNPDMKGFSGDREAIKLWESILNSLRIRPVTSLDLSIK